MSEGYGIYINEPQKHPFDQTYSIALTSRPTNTHTWALLMGANGEVISIMEVPTSWPTFDEQWELDGIRLRMLVERLELAVKTI